MFIYDLSDLVVFTGVHLGEQVLVAIR